MKKITAICFTLLFPLMADNQMTTVQIDESIGGAENMVISIEFGMGDLSVSPGSSNKAVTGSVSYDNRFADVEYDYDVDGDTGEFSLETDWEGKEQDSGESKGSEAELFVTDDLPLQFSIDLGLGNAIFNLDKLYVEEFELENGLGDVTVDFGKKGNRMTCDHIDVNTGLGSAEILNISNSLATEMEFECGLGSMDLDFSGKLREDMKIDISVGLGSIDILIPEGVNVIFEHDASFLASVDLPRFDKIDSDTYRSKTFKKGKPVLYFSASVGMGSIDLEWTN